MMDRKSNFIPLIIVLLALVVAGLVTLIVPTPKEGSRPETSSLISPPVPTAPSTEVIPSAPITIEGTGMTIPLDSAKLTACIEGSVIWVNPEFAPYRKVKQGTELVKLDPHASQARVAELKAQLEQVKLEIADESARAYNLVGEHEADERKKGSSSELVVRLPQRRALKAKQEAIESALHLAESDLKSTTIVAPYDAIIETKEVNVGSYLHLGAPIAHISSDGPRLVEIRVPVNKLDLLLQSNGRLEDCTVKASCRITASSGPNNFGYEWTGKVASSVQMIDRDSGCFVVVAELETNDANPTGWKVAPINLPVLVTLTAPVSKD